MNESSANDSRTVPPSGATTRARVLLVDDEDAFRKALARQLSARGYDVLDVGGGEEAIRVARHQEPDVIVLDQMMPGMDGIETLQEIKRINPAVQVIMLTGYADTESARVTGKHDVYQYLGKPCELQTLIQAIEAARQEHAFAHVRHEIPDVRTERFWSWFFGVPNHRPGIIVLGFLLFVSILLMPTPQKLSDLLTAPKTGAPGEKIVGFAEYRKLAKGQTIADHYCSKAGLYREEVRADGSRARVVLGAGQVAFRAKAMTGCLLVATLFWATGAVPVGITAILTGVIMIFFGVFPPALAAKAFAKDSVIFVFGVLAISAAIGKTGLDRRIGLLLLGTSYSLWRFAFLFAPMLAVSASFLSEHALVAFLAPILLMVYLSAIKSAGLKRDRNLAVMLLLMLTFVANVGGPGSPAAGGRNAVMVGILSDYGVSISFGQWMKMGLPFVPVMALVVAAYFYLVFRRRVEVPRMNVAAAVRREAEKIGRMTPDEYKAAAVLVLLIVLWATGSETFGMGGPTLLCIFVLNILRVLRWRDINNIHWDVVALYAAASAIGDALASTGAALWLADSLISAVPPAFQTGKGLCVSASLITGCLTNFMSDGATVAAIGPITVPMATLGGASPIQVGLATAFASSFANMFIVGTPNNAIVYSYAKDPETGEQLVTNRDFLVHGAAILVLNFLVLWFWTFWGYWEWMGLK